MLYTSRQGGNRETRATSVVDGELGGSTGGNQVGVAVADSLDGPWVKYPDRW